MAKETGVKTVTPTRVRKGRPVRLDMTPEDHKRLEQCARRRGLTKASFARMAVLEFIQRDEGRSS
jgi:hypothetical protein